MPSGSTQLTAVIGSPIRHSLSPAIFNAAYAAAGLDWTMVALEVTADTAPVALAGAQALGIRAVSVTMPLKSVLAGLVDTCSATATTLGAVNSVRLAADRTEGDNTDGGGLLDALGAEAGVDPRGQTCVVLGAGGAARAVALALAGAGAASVTVVNRTAANAAAAAALAGPVGHVGTEGDVAGADFVINATSVGMAGTATAGATIVDPSLLRPGQVVVDLVYHPLRTPLLEAASARGAVAVSGVGMLVYQAARQFAWWTATEAPVAAMQKAADEVLGR